jgi:hypothetical protein
MWRGKSVKKEDYKNQSSRLSREANKRKVQDIRTKSKTRSINHLKTHKNLFLLLNFIFVDCFLFYFLYVCSFKFVCFCLFKIIFVIFVCLSPFIRAYFFHNFLLNDALWLFRQCVVLWVGVYRKWFCLF